MTGTRFISGLALTFAATAGSAQIVLDGTVGPAGPLTGPAYTIPDTLGTQVGTNLFHSFADFNVRNGETATFVSNFAGTTQNVIGRVTGAGVSRIDGVLASSVAGASLWLVNPNGLVLGPGAALDVQGSFYASTADAVLLPNGGRFDATNPSASTLAIGDPVAFGFLDAQMGSIAVDGATLRVPSGATLALVGGPIDLSAATLSAPAGHVTLAAAAAPGNVAIASGIGADAGVALGDITLTATSLMTTGVGTGGGGGSVTGAEGGSGGGGGGSGNGGSGAGGSGGNVGGAAGGGGSGATRPDVFIEGGRFVMREASRIGTSTTTSAAATGDVVIAAVDAALLGGSQIRTGTTGATPGGRVSMTATGSVRIDGAAAELGGGSGGSGPGGGAGSAGGTSGGAGNGGGSGGGGGGGGGGAGGDTPSTASGIFSDVAEGASGRGGAIEISATQLRIAHGAEVSSGTRGVGNAGDIALRATHRLTVIQESQVNASTNGAGAGGAIRLEAPIVETLDGARVGSTTQSTGNGGSITIVAPEAFVATGTNGVADPAGNRGSRITAASFFTATGDSGSIFVDAGRIELDDGARLSSSTSGIGDGGSVTLAATGDMSLRGARADGAGSAIKASTEVEPDEIGAIHEPRTGRAGAVAVSAASLTLADGAEIVGNTALLGAGGSVAIDVGALRVSSARIASESTAVGAGAGNAGEIAINAHTIALDNAAQISAATADGAGGDVALTARSIALTGGAAVSARSSGAGKAGALRLTATDALTLDASALRTSAPRSAGGDIVIRAGRTVQLADSTIGAEAGGVTATDAGGNVTIDPDYVLMNGSDILASANAGNGGNVTIVAGFFVASADSAIDASSARGLDGAILIDAPDELTGSVLPLETPPPAQGRLFALNCVPRLARERSTLTVQSRSSPRVPAGYLPSPTLLTAEPELLAGCR